MVQGFKKVIEIDGVVYPSVAAASRATGLSETPLHRWIELGRYRVVDQSRPSRPCRSVIRSDGTKYASAKEAAEANFICYTSINRAIKMQRKCAGYMWRWEEVA